jgi:SAM-dependent methyltransferase
MSNHLHPSRSDESPYPILYHAHHRDYKSDLPFWLSLARKQGSPILELGCGTGRVLVPLATAGFTIYGLDLDPGMLEICCQGVPSPVAADVHTIQADLSSFKIETHFPLILLPCNTFSSLATEARKSTLACVYQHLSPEGLFAVSLPNPEILSQVDPSDHSEIEMTFPHPKTLNPVQVSYDINRTDHNVHIDWHYDQLLPDGQVDRVTVSTIHWLTTTTEYLNDFTQADFTVETLYGDFDYSPYSSNAPNLIILAKT